MEGDDTMSEKINLVISKELKQEAQEKAKTMGLNLSSYIRLLLTQEVKK